MAAPPDGCFTPRPGSELHPSGHEVPHRPPQSRHLPREGNPKPTVAVAASIALRSSGRWAALGKSRGCSQSGHQSRCHTAAARQQLKQAEGIRNCKKKHAWLEGIPLQHPRCWYGGLQPGPEPAQTPPGPPATASGADTNFTTSATSIGSLFTHLANPVFKKMTCVLFMVSSSQTANKNAFVILVFQRL